MHFSIEMCLPPFGKVERFLDAKERNEHESRLCLGGLYEAAILETDDEKLQKRIQAAKAAIDVRLHEIQLEHGGTREERQAIADALSGLNVLRILLDRRSHDTGSSNG